MNNHRVFIGWFTETDVKHLKSGALQVYGKLKKRIPSQVISKILKVFKAFSNANFFAGVFQGFC